MASAKKKTKTQAVKRTNELHLTKIELEFLRDVFSVRLPVNMQSVSQSLATATGRQTLEALLWAKIASVCAKAGVDLNEDAPDFVVTLLETPPLGVFQVPTGDEQEQAEPGVEDLMAVFSKEEKK